MMASFPPACVSFRLPLRSSLASRSHGRFLLLPPTFLVAVHIGLCVHANQRLQRTGLRVMHLRPAPHMVNLALGHLPGLACQKPSLGHHQCGVSENRIIRSYIASRSNGVSRAAEECLARRSSMRSEVRPPGEEPRSVLWWSGPRDIGITSWPARARARQRAMRYYG